MVLRRVTEHLGKQHWTAVFLDLVVVVVGVFLGIQAANWNESRKERVEERRYYAQILDDLRVDQQALMWAQKRADTFDVAAEDTLRAMRSGLPQNLAPGRLAIQIHYAGFLYIPHPSRRTYDELISAGKLGLLRNRAAKAAIADYYESFETLRQWDQLLRGQQGRYWDVTAGVLPRSVLKAVIRGREPTLTVAQASEILAALRARGGAHDLLIGMAAHQERLRRDSEKLEEKGRVLIAELEPLIAS
jgi:hypothetical protein